MRFQSVLLLCATIAACSPPAERTTTEAITEAPSADMASQRAAPGIGVTAAPGVAFSYRYAFSLPAERITTVQETHALACERLGPARCRITGMRYRLLGENDIEAMLAFKLDPRIARAFGKSGIAQVDAATGTLVDAEIAGTDAGAAITQLSTDRARAAAEIARIDGELAKRGLSAYEREERQRQRAEFVRQIAATADSTTQARESLANTPMVFDYRSGAAIRGFDASAPLTSALDTAMRSAQVTLAFVFGAIAIFGPPGLVVLLGWLGWRRFRNYRAAPATRSTTEA